MKNLLFSGIIITCLYCSQACAASTARIVEEGNKLYKVQKYQDALKRYDQALSRKTDSAIVNFDAGTAQYKTHEYQKAISSFEKSLLTEDKPLEAGANYNLGNAKYMLGLTKENTDLEGAIRLLGGALDNYKRTMALTPKDEDAKVNYQIVEKKLKELKEKLKQQEQKKEQAQSSMQSEGSGGAPAQQQQGQAAEEENKSASTPEHRGEKEAQEYKGTSAQEQPGQQGQQVQEQPGPQEQEGQKAQEQQVAAQPGDSKEMSQEEARMLLEGYRHEEYSAGMLKDDRHGTEEKVLKDW